MDTGINTKEINQNADLPNIAIDQYDYGNIMLAEAQPRAERWRVREEFGYAMQCSSVCDSIV